MAHPRLRRLAAQTACVSTLAGAGLAAIGVTAAHAATGTSSYTCSLTGLAPETESSTLELTAPDTGSVGGTATIAIDQPSGSTTSPVAITSVTISGTATVSGDDSATTLAFSGTGGSSDAGAVPAEVDTSGSLALPSAAGTVTVTLPTSYSLSVVLTGLGTESGTCTTSSPTSESITVS
jgi:hypothetical protein